MRKEVDEEVYSTGKALILDGSYTELIRMIEGEVPWLRNKPELITQFAQLAEWNQPLNRELQRVALGIWEDVKGARKRSEKLHTWLERVLIIFIGLGSLSGFISLIWLVSQL